MAGGRNKNSSKNNNNNKKNAPKEEVASVAPESAAVEVVSTQASASASKVSPHPSVIENSVAAPEVASQSASEPSASRSVASTPTNKSVHYDDVYANKDHEEIDFYVPQDRDTACETVADTSMALESCYAASPAVSPLRHSTELERTNPALAKTATPAKKSFFSEATAQTPPSSSSGRLVSPIAKVGSAHCTPEKEVVGLAQSSAGRTIPIYISPTGKSPARAAAKGPAQEVPLHADSADEEVGEDDTWRDVGEDSAEEVVATASRIQAAHVVSGEQQRSLSAVSLHGTPPGAETRLQKEGATAVTSTSSSTSQSAALSPVEVAESVVTKMLESLGCGAKGDAQPTLLQETLDLALWLPRRVVGLWLWLLFLVGSFFAAVVGYAVSAALWVVWAPVTLSQRAVAAVYQGALGLVVTSLNRLPGGHRIPKATNGHVHKE